MNKGVLKGTNTDGSNPTNNEKNATVQKESLVLGTNRFFVDGLVPTRMFVSKYQPIKVNGITGWAKP